MRPPLRHAAEQVLADPDGISHGGQGRFTAPMGSACDRDAHAHVEVLVEHVMLGHPDVVQDLSEFLVEPVGLGRVGRPRSSRPRTR
jgi:hypothetical protein